MSKAAVDAFPALEGVSADVIVVDGFEETDNIGAKAFRTWIEGCFVATEHISPALITDSPCYDV